MREVEGDSCGASVCPFSTEIKRGDLAMMYLVTQPVVLGVQCFSWLFNTYSVSNIDPDVREPCDLE